MVMRASHIIIYDGECVLCESSVRFIVKHDKAGLCRFTQAQSDTGRRIQSDLGIDALALESVVLVKDSEVYDKSDAAMEIARILDGPWKMLAIFRFVPKGLRDGVYLWIARHRHRWFGKKDLCSMPDKSIKQRII